MSPTQNTEPAVVAETPEILSETETLEQQFANIAKTTKSLKSMIVALETEQRQLKVAIKAELKSKKGARRQRKDSGKKSSFKEIQVSAELAKFLGVEKGTKMARPEATKMVYAYIKKNGLYFDSLPHTVMDPDSKLTKLLGPFNLPVRSPKPELGNGLSIYNIQKYLSKHLNTVSA
jgi:chromatin remodeling complex protein RSC6